MSGGARVARPTLFWTHSEAVIPAKLVPACFKRGAGIQLNKIGFRVKPGMTIKGKGRSTRYTSDKQPTIWKSLVAPPIT